MESRISQEQMIESLNGLQEPGLEMRLVLKIVPNIPELLVNYRVEKNLQNKYFYKTIPSVIETFDKLKTKQKLQ